MAYGRRPAVAEPVGLGVDGRLEVVVVERTRPHDVGRQDVVEHHVAGGFVRRVGAEHDRAGQAEVVGGRRGHAHVVGLPTAAGHQRVATLVDGVGAQVLELAHLVPAAAQAR